MIIPLIIDTATTARSPHLESRERFIPRILGAPPEELLDEKLGGAKPVVGMVLPAGYTFNPDGTAIYLTMGALFIAQATNTALNLRDQLTVLGVMLFTSKVRPE